METTAEASQGADNRNVVDLGYENQSLAEEDILNLRRSTGLDRREMVEKICAGSKTFKEKTTFSQEKYIRKKTQKHVDILRLQRPTIRLLVDCYYQQNPMKIMNLRADLLAEILELRFKIFCNIKFFFIRQIRSEILKNEKSLKHHYWQDQIGQIRVIENLAKTRQIGRVPGKRTNASFSFSLP